MKPLKKREILILSTAIIAGITVVMLMGLPRGEMVTHAKHPPIYFYRNEILDAFPGKSGSGTFEDTYVIEDLLMDASSTGIRLDGINRYLIVKGCTFGDASIGIKIENCANIKIQGCNFTDNPQRRHRYPRKRKSMLKRLLI